MKPIIKSIFRPIANRHYTDKKTSIIMYICSYALILLIGLYIAIFIDSVFWFVLGGIVVLGFIRYLVFDAILDELEWKSTWYHFYSDEVTPHTPEQALIKKYEQNPNPENYKALQKHLQAK